MADTYDVVSQEDTTVVLGNRFVPARTITFRTKPSGIQSHVDIPTDAYTPERAHAMIAAEVDKLEAVQSL